MIPGHFPGLYGISSDGLATHVGFPVKVIAGDDWSRVPQIAHLMRRVFSRLAALRLLVIAGQLLVAAPCQSRKSAAELGKLFKLFKGHDTSEPYSASI
jgi:hypothetical protein